VKGGGWIEIGVIGVYGAFIAYKIQDVKQSAKWRRISWTIFSIVFFSQLALGLLGFERFLMTGDLHLPIPVMIMSGPVFRGELSIMTFLFLSTLILTGPAWCSQLCYFGAIDNLSAQKNNPAKGKIKNRAALKFSFLFLIIMVTLLLRWFHVSLVISTILAVLFGVGGILVILFISRKKGKMIHCLTWCPIGTIVSYGKYINPFRMYIDSSCTLCMKCTSYCKYDALNPEDIKSGKPSVTCTYCGDCLSACHVNSIKYKFFRMKPENARRFYLFLTVSFHAVFLALGRI
ncbi:MAG: 4Fe-4S binding protein, partial [Bacteroidales bacterium]